MSQSFKDYEHIIIDGGSTDGSVGVIKDALKNEDYASHVSYWCSEQDGGIYPAMNKGVKKANGSYLLMLNSGDYLTNGLLLEQVSKELPKDSECVFYGSVDYYDDRGFMETYSISHNRLSEQNICHQSCFIGKGVHSAIGDYNCDYKLLADYDFLRRAYVNGIKFAHIPFVIANCEMGGVSQSNRKKALAEMYRIKKTEFPNKRKKPIKKYFAAALKFLLPGWATVLLKAADRYFCKFFLRHV